MKNLRSPNRVRGNKRLMAVIGYTFIITSEIFFSRLFCKIVDLSTLFINDLYIFYEVYNNHSVLLLKLYKAFYLKKGSFSTDAPSFSSYSTKYTILSV